MSEVSTIASIAQDADASARRALNATDTPADAQEEPDEEPEEPAPDERQLNALLRKAENAFTKGNKGLLLSRVECGKWCHAVYVLRFEQGHKDRSFTSQLIFNRLAVHADSKRECDASELAKMHKCVELLAGGDAWKTLTVGKLYDMLSLVTRVDGSENYMIFDAAKTEQAKALFAWACGDGISRPSREDIHNRVLELTDPAKYAEKQKREEVKKAEQAQDASATDEPDDEPAEAPENLIPTEPEARPTAPNWKDIPEDMAALYKEACRQEPGHSGDGMCGFAKELVWTTAMVKGLVAGIADSQDGARAEEALQELVNAIADQYSIFPESELTEAA